MDYKNMTDNERLAALLAAAAETPNFLRLAQEMNRRFKNPYRAADMLLAVAGPILREEDGQHE